MFRRNPDNADLDNQAKILEQQWKSFSHFLETESEEETAKRNRKFWKKKTDGATSVRWQVEGQSGQPPGLGDVIAAVRSVEQKWKEKDRFIGGKPQKLFRSFCNSLQGHSNMLQMLPSQNQYLSIFCGALTSLLEVGIPCRPFTTFQERLLYIDSTHCFLGIRQPSKNIGGSRYSTG